MGGILLSACLLLGLFAATACNRREGGGPSGGPAATGTSITGTGLTWPDSSFQQADNTRSDGSAQEGTTAESQTVSSSNTGPTVPVSSAQRSSSRPSAPSTTVSSASSGEFRGAWVSYPELNAALSGAKNAEQARAAIDRIMESCLSFQLNAVIFHVRANSDAYYDSAVFPHAAAAAPLIRQGFDPLAYAVEAAHRRGMELHAWVNPYRIGVNLGYKQCDDVFSRTDASGKITYYYDPSSDKVKKLINDGLKELLRYDIDGIQYDDYFYPDMDQNGPEDFEKEAYAPYAEHMTIGEWRRTHVSAMVSRSYNTAHQKKGCVFGISPAHGVTRNETEKYADVRTWMKQRGYIDYICPQIYFGFQNQASAFDKAVAEWLGYPRHGGLNVYVGVAVYKTGIENDAYAGTGKAEWGTNDDIMARSVRLLRETAGCSGMIFYSYSYFDPAKARETPYKQAVAQQEMAHLLAELKKK